MSKTDRSALSPRRTWLWPGLIVLLIFGAGVALVLVDWERWDLEREIALLNKEFSSERQYRFMKLEVAVGAEGKEIMLGGAVATKADLEALKKRIAPRLAPWTDSYEMKYWVYMKPESFQ